ncbi:ACP phosphodiesterase [Marinomonas atlantica]|uniref:ACP phosphodiesterase n=1 Tax=Marinomonas atlantica TaxID=1806668 RepID=UPI0008296FE5|nr:ACP phosphodiesterase [Marinomonas atlantica]MCO4786292.1 DUF479 domain-containing protein [Marinomonas atlantica]
MNYVAHLHLAKITQTSYAGSLLGDFPWQPDPSVPKLLQGWRLHQAVDTFVDAHTESARFKSMPRQGRRRFAGIVQDIAMDYWLIRHWSDYDVQPFDSFASEAVLALIADKAYCPERLQRMITSLEDYNWLKELGTYQGVERAIHSIQKRWSLGHYLDPFIDELDVLLEQAHEPFKRLYPDVISAAQKRVLDGI